MKRVHSLLLMAAALLPAVFAKAQCPDLGATRKTVASSFHSSVIIDYTGAVRYWGDGASHTSAGTNALSPVTLTGYTGTPKAVAAGSTGAAQQHQHFLLTSTGLYGWGYSNNTINTGVTGNVVLTDMTASLPVGIATVNFIEASSGGVAIVTTTGEVYVRQGGGSGPNTALVYGDGSTGTTMTSTWHKVKLNSSTDLTGVTRLSYAGRGLMALTSAGKLYVWGNNVMLGNGTSFADRNYATEMTLPATVTVADMGIITKYDYDGNAAHASQFILGTNGKIYGVGENYHGCLGQGTETDQTNWVTVKSAAGGSTELTNVVQLSTNNPYLLATAYYSVGALTSSGQLYLWGDNSYSMIGTSSATFTHYTLPRIPPNFNVNEAQIGYFKMGGHTTIAFLSGTNKFCYVGHKIRGSMGDGIGTEEERTAYDCVNTPPEYICEPPAPMGCPTPSANDLVASSTHGTVVMNGQPSVTYWGEGTSSAEAGVSVATPRVLYEYNGTPKGVAASGVGETPAASGTQMWILTTQGVWGWGYSGNTINASVPGAVGLTILPLPVAASGISFIRSSRGAIALVTNSGAVYVRAGNGSVASGRVYGDGSSALDAAGSTVWHQVTTAASTPLTGVRELSFAGTAAMAITTGGQVYVWGDRVFTGTGGVTDLSRATAMTLHADFTGGMIPKTAEIIQSGTNEAAQFLLGSNGKVYSLGRNLNGVLGLGVTTTTTVNTAWTATGLASVRKMTSNNPFANGTYSMGAITVDGTVFLWGSNSNGMLGSPAGTVDIYTPATPPGIATASAAGVEIGGHQTIIFPKSGSQFYFAGHNTGGAKGDNTATGNITPFALGADVVNCAGVVYNISGHLYQDPNGMTNNLVNGTGINTLTTTTMYANLLDENGYVVDTTSINPTTGVFNFTGFPSGNYTVQISATKGTLFTAPPASGIPSGWTFTGEQLGTVAGAGIDPGTADGRLPISLSASVTDANIGVEQLPIAATTTGASQPYNPLGSKVPNIFGFFDNDGTVTDVRLSGFPSNVVSITVNGTVYTAAGGGGTTAFPAGGLTIPVSSGVLTYPIFVVPTGPGVTVEIPFYSKDNAGFESALPGSVSIPFVNSGLSVSGSVWADANANGTKEPAESFVNAARAGETLYALLVQTNNTPNGVPQVVSSAAIPAGGGYTFANVPNGNNYQLRIVSLPSAPAVGTVASTIAPQLANGYLGVSVNNGGSAPATTTTATQQLTITGLSTSLSNRNFGIQQVPTANSDSYTITRPGGHWEYSLTSTYGLGPLRGSDAEDMPATGSLSGKTVTITNISGLNGNVLTYNGTTVTAGTTISSYDPALLKIRFEGTGSTSASFNFTYTDIGGSVSPTPATYSILWGTALPLSLVSFDVQKQQGKVLVSWTTAAETDMSGFTVLRSDNGTQWQELTTVAPKGSGTYQYLDQNPMSGLSYYRLKMTEVSGSYAMSPTRSVSFDGTATETLSVYPNPVTDKLSVRSDKGILSLEITDVTGRKVYEVSGNIPQEIETKGWPDGTYFIRAELTDHTVTQYRIGKSSK